MQRVFWLVAALVLASADAGSVVPKFCSGRRPCVASPERVGRGVEPAASVAGIGITVSDLDRAVAFYTGVLDFTASPEIALGGAEFERECGLAGARARRAELRLGDERIWLTQYLEPVGRAMPADSRSHDRWFQHIAVVVSDIDAAYARLRKHKVRHVSSGPQTLPETIPAAAGIRAFYFKDPDGHVLEVIQYPPGKGDPRWRRGAG
ncbi:MAG: VOC family protein, partial [Phycisphaerales bacterium]